MYSLREKEQDEMREFKVEEKFTLHTNDTVGIWSAR